MIATRREEDKKSRAVSGPVEEYGAQEEMLDALIEEIDAKKESERKEQETRDKLNSDLTRQDEEIRNQAVSQKSSRGEIGEYKREGEALSSDGTPLRSAT